MVDSDAVPCAPIAAPPGLDVEVLEMDVPVLTVDVVVPEVEGLEIKIGWDVVLDVVPDPEVEVLDVKTVEFVTPIVLEVFATALTGATALTTLSGP